MGKLIRRDQRLIADLLDFSQARLGNGLNVHLNSIDLPALVAESLEDLRLSRPRARAYGGTVTVVSEGGATSFRAMLPRFPVPVS